MKRRNFLKSSLSAGSALLILPSGLRSAPSKNETLQLAQIGCGRMGRGDMKNAIGAGWGASVNARIVAVCDVDRWRLNEARSLAEGMYREKGETAVDIQTYADHREVLNRSDIDGIIVSTPENWHALIGVAAADAGKHMYVQKPLTYFIPEGQALVDAVRRNKVILQTGSQQRSSVYFRQVCTIIRNNWLGELKRIEVEVPTDKGRADGAPTEPPAGFDYERWLGPSAELPYIESRTHPQNAFSRPGWLQVERFCRGMITGWGSHMYDIAQWSMGVDADSGPTDVRATGEFPDRGLFDVHVGYSGDAHYANGVEMISRNGHAGVRFVTEDGWAHCARGKMDCSDRELLRRKPGEGDVALYFSRNHMEDFLVSAREGADPICPVEVGHRSNTVCVLHHLSMKLGGRKIHWDPENEVVLNDPEVARMVQEPMREPYTL